MSGINTLVPALAATYPTRWRHALAEPKLNQPPCRWTIASPDRQSAGCTQSPGVPPKGVCFEGHDAAWQYALHIARSTFFSRLKRLIEPTSAST